MHGGANAVVSAATANVAGHGSVDIGVGGIRISRQQGRGGHDLTGLAVTTLGYVQFHPSFLHGGQFTVFRQPFNRGDVFTGYSGNWRGAGTDRRAVKVDRASTTLGDATTVLGADQANRVSEYPQQRCGRIHILNRVRLIVYRQLYCSHSESRY